MNCARCAHYDRRNNACRAMLYKNGKPKPLPRPNLIKFCTMFEQYTGVKRRKLRKV